MSETVVEQSLFQPEKEDTTTMNTYAYDAQGSVNNRVEIFKRHVQNIIAAMKFKQWSEK